MDTCHSKQIIENLCFPSCAVFKMFLLVLLGYNLVHKIEGMTVLRLVFSFRKIKLTLLSMYRPRVKHKLWGFAWWQMGQIGE